MKQKSKYNYIDIIQIFRGIAALMVVLHHTLGSVFYYHKLNYAYFDSLAYFGKFGVDFFFILSGFIISYNAFFKYNKPNTFENYLKNRFLRIFVPYLPIGILMLVLYTFFPDASNSNRSISIITSLTLFPVGNPALSVAWTLTYELIYYILFSVFIFSKKGWNIFALIWCFFIILFNYSPFKTLHFLEIDFFQALFSLYNFEFLMGYFLSIFIIYKKKITIEILVAIFAVALFFFSSTILYKNPIFYFQSNLLFAIIIFVVLYWFIGRNFKINKYALFMVIGNASYSIYLVHNPLQTILVRLYPKINSVQSLILVLLLSIVFSVVLGYLYFLVFEKNAIRKIKSFARDL